MQIQLICIDMDGTLLDDKGIISEKNKKALKQAYEKGCTIALTTGRSCYGAKAVLQEIGIKGPIIGSNGAQIMLPEANDFFYLNTMKPKSLDVFLETSKKYKLDTYLMADWGIVSTYVLPDHHVFHQMNKVLPENAKLRVEVVNDFTEAYEKFPDDILKVICVEDIEKEKLNTLRKELEAIDGFEVVATWHNNIEIMNKGISKGEGVKRLADYLHIPKEKVMCIGDSENDLSMLQYAGLSIAMGNALECLKETADYITDDHTQSGVAKAIEKYVLSSC